MDALARRNGIACIRLSGFVDLSEKHDQEYFADGMAEEILDLLAKIPELKVIGRTSSFSFKENRPTCHPSARISASPTS